MRRYIQTGITKLENLAEQADDGLNSVEIIAKSGYVTTKVVDSKRSQLFDDEGVLKFYSSITGDITTVT